MIILDFSGGNSCLNSWPIAKQMIDALAEIDKERKCIIKWQLFREAPPNVPLVIFGRVYDYAHKLGFKTTASVFDIDSLYHLLRFDIPFVKIANRRDLDWLIGEVPRKIPVVVSKNSQTKFSGEYIPIDFIAPHTFKVLHCISKYPATIEDYESDDYDFRYDGISDHTTDWALYRKYQPEIYEVHFRLPTTTGPDSLPFARLPSQIAEIL